MERFNPSFFFEGRRLITALFGNLRQLFIGALFFC
jgi:hypothetical protein